MVKGQSEVRENARSSPRGPLLAYRITSCWNDSFFRRNEFAKYAFAVLVAPWTHGLEALPEYPATTDPGDALMLTFMLLAAKAGKIGNRELLGNWLYGVSLRTAMKARSIYPPSPARTAGSGGLRLDRSPRLKSTKISFAISAEESARSPKNTAPPSFFAIWKAGPAGTSARAAPLGRQHRRSPAHAGKRAVESRLHRRHRHFSVALLRRGSRFGVARKGTRRALARATSVAAIQLSTGVIETVGARPPARSSI